MWRKFWIVAIVSVVTSALRAEPPQEQRGLEEWKPSGFILESVYSKYIAARISRELTDTPVLWSELYLDLPKGFFTDLWMSNGLDDTNFSSDNFGDEIDFAFGWKGKLGSWDVKVAVVYMDIVPLSTVGSGDDVLSYALFTSPGEYTFDKTFLGTHSFRPELRMEWMSSADDFQAGAFVFLPNVTHTWKEPFGIKPLSFINQYRLAYDSGFRANDGDGLFFQVDGGLNWRLTKDLIHLSGLSHRCAPD